MEWCHTNSMVNDMVNRQEKIMIDNSWIGRLVTEKEELIAKLDKLSKFIDSGFFEELGEVDKKLFLAQYGAMIAYENILTIRLDLA